MMMFLWDSIGKNHQQHQKRHFQVVFATHFFYTLFCQQHQKRHFQVVFDVVFCLYISIETTSNLHVPNGFPYKMNGNELYLNTFFNVPSGSQLELPQQVRIRFCSPGMRQYKIKNWVRTEYT